MIAAFVIWTACALIPLFLAVHAWNAKTPVGFFSNEEPPEVTDVRAYNHAVSLLWAGYALVFELLGIPFLFSHQNSPVFILPVLSTVFLSIGQILVYLHILSKHRK